MTSKHTPGPWEVWEGNLEVWPGVTENSPGRLTAKPGSERICEVGDGFGDEDDPVLQANARLIAAAPDLLEAMRAMLSATNPLTVCSPRDMAAIRNHAAAAITKATGGGA